jgi:hypothetical protein
VKRNLEGNSCIPEPIFSCLASKEIIDISKKMGVNINEQNMESIELLKEMELARQCLDQKKIEILQKKDEDNMVKRNDEYIGNQTNEESETDDFILVQSRKKKREYRKGIKKGCKGKVQEHLGLHKKIRNTGKIPKSVDDINTNKNGSK